MSSHLHHSGALCAPSLLILELTVCLYAGDKEIRVYASEKIPVSRKDEGVTLPIFSFSCPSTEGVKRKN
jgi:hypothetical protein